MFNKLTCKYSTTILLRYCQSYDRLTTDVWFFLTSYEERGVFLRYVLFLKSFSVCIHFTLCRFGLSTWIEVLIDWLIDWLIDCGRGCLVCQLYVVKESDELRYTFSTRPVYVRPSSDDFLEYIIIYVIIRMNCSLKNKKLNKNKWKRKTHNVSKNTTCQMHTNYIRTVEEQSNINVECRWHGNARINAQN